MGAQVLVCVLIRVVQQVTVISSKTFSPGQDLDRVFRLSHLSDMVSWGTGPLS